MMFFGLSACTEPEVDCKEEPAAFTDAIGVTCDAEPCSVITLTAPPITGASEGEVTYTWDLGAENTAEGESVTLAVPDGERTFQLTATTACGKVLEATTAYKSFGAATDAGVAVVSGCGGGLKVMTQIMNCVSGSPTYKFWDADTILGASSAANRMAAPGDSCSGATTTAPKSTTWSPATVGACYQRSGGLVVLYPGVDPNGTTATLDLQPIPNGGATIEKGVFRIRHEKGATAIGAIVEYECPADGPQSIVISSVEPDLDADGFADADSADGGDDCDDTNADIHPDAEELCNEVDDDCDGDIDEDVSVEWHADADADGYGDPATTQSACSAPPGYVTDATDCDDSDPTVFPGATDPAGDGLDQDCDGAD